MQSSIRRDHALIALLVAGILANFGAMSLAKNRKFTQPEPLPIPQEFHGWQGTSIPTDKITQGILPNARIMQVVYQKPQTPPTDVVIIASRDPNDMHTPERCFMGSGFEIVNTTTRDVTVDGPNPGSWKFNRVIIRSPDGQALVLYGYDGVAMLGSSTVWARVVMKVSGPTAKPAYFVRVSSAINGNVEETEKRLMTFLEDLMRERKTWQLAATP